jgi:hypothetical protein
MPTEPLSAASLADASEPPITTRGAASFSTTDSSGGVKNGFTRATCAPAASTASTATTASIEVGIATATLSLATPSAVRRSLSPITLRASAPYVRRLCRQTMAVAFGCSLTAARKACTTLAGRGPSLTLALRCRPRRSPWPRPALRRRAPRL